jgi:UDP-glucose 4-epimerase
MKLLITGGAGYIGSHVAKLAQKSGHDCVVIDNLSTGLSARVSGRLVEMDLASLGASELLINLMKQENFDAVIHLAARKQVGQSVEFPEMYFLDNIGALGNLLKAMRAVNLKSLVFSSSAAAYGMPDVESVSEDYDAKPINPYGETKLVGEWMVRNAKVWGLKAVSLRYFNVAGCGYPDLADTAELNLIPIAISAVKKGVAPKVFGTDYDTADGSCIRDYVHIHDLARAHLMTLDYLDTENRPFDVFNVGSGVGASVIEVLAALKTASGIDFASDLEPRRAGDPPKLVANVERISDVMGFRTEFGLTKIVQSAWEAS